jgi:hypothetical protein
MHRALVGKEREDHLHDFLAHWPPGSTSKQVVSHRFCAAVDGSRSWCDMEGGLEWRFSGMGVLGTDTKQIPDTKHQIPDMHMYIRSTHVQTDREAKQAFSDFRSAAQFDPHACVHVHM